MKSVLQFLIRIPGLLAIGLVRLYQIFLSPIFGNQCRFTPTCSNYMIQAIQKYGALRGIWKGTFRIMRCHPWHPGGEDPP